MRLLIIDRAAIRTYTDADTPRPREADQHWRTARTTIASKARWPIGLEYLSSLDLWLASALQLEVRPWRSVASRARVAGLDRPITWSAGPRSLQHARLRVRFGHGTAKKQPARATLCRTCTSRVAQPSFAAALLRPAAQCFTSSQQRGGARGHGALGWQALWARTANCHGVR